MVLLEIDKAYPGHERLLGEHRCIEFLKNPRADEKERIAQIFYCLYDTGRAAQKDGTFSFSRCCLFFATTRLTYVIRKGWKRIRVEVTVSKPGVQITGLFLCLVPFVHTLFR